MLWRVACTVLISTFHCMDSVLSHLVSWKWDWVPLCTRVHVVVWSQHVCACQHQFSFCFDRRTGSHFFFIVSVSQFQAIARAERPAREPMQSLPAAPPVARHLDCTERTELMSNFSETLASSCPAALALSGVLQRLQHVEEKINQVTSSSSLCSSLRFPSQLIFTLLFCTYSHRSVRPPQNTPLIKNTHTSNHEKRFKPLYPSLSPLKQNWKENQRANYVSFLPACCKLWEVWVLCLKHESGGGKAKTSRRLKINLIG